MASVQTLAWEFADMGMCFVMYGIFLAVGNF